MTKLLTIACLVFSLAVTSGCGSIKDSEEYTLPKSTGSTLPIPQRVEAGPLTGGDSAWFFKLTGPTDDVLKEALAFNRVVQSLQFSNDGTPRYSIPEGWLISNGPPPRYQTIAIPDTDPALEVTLSRLPFTGDKASDYLLANINRWREQLALPALTGDDWLPKAQESGEVTITPSSNRLVAMINLTGVTKEFAMTRVLGAIILDLPNQTGTPTVSGTASPLSLQTPEGWEQNAGNSMRLASFAAKHESGDVDISVMRLGGGGDVLSNVNRWRDQVALPAYTEAELEADTKAMTISEQPATYVEAIGPEQSIFAAIISDGDAKWFFKAQGVVASMDAEREHFKQFLETAKIDLQAK